MKEAVDRDVKYMEQNRDGSLRVDQSRHTVDGGGREGPLEQGSTTVGLLRPGMHLWNIIFVYFVNIKPIITKMSLFIFC